MSAVSLRHFVFAVGITALLAVSFPRPSAASADSDGDGLANAWESHWGLTDPSLWDSNNNGLSDASEDPDGDGLSNLAEQQLGTDPTKADSNGNGIADGLDDANRNGVPDGIQQDKRPLPRHLRPTLGAAPNDTAVSYSNGCHTFAGSSTIHPCSYGDAAGTTSIAIFGDSHALQWVPALIPAANASHWRLIAITKSGCPSVDVRFVGAFPNDVVPCQQWRHKAIAWLRAHVPSLIVISNSFGYNIVDAHGHHIPRDAAWQAGLSRTLSQLPPPAGRLVIGDTPHMDINPIPCMRHHPADLSACETRRRAALRPPHDAAELDAAAANRARFVTLNALVCPYDPCPIVDRNVVMWRNDTHLTATWVSLLWPSLQATIGDALAANQPASGGAPSSLVHIR